LAGGRGWTSSTPLYVGNLLRHGFRNRLKFHVLQSNRHGFRNRLKCHLLSLIVVFCHEIHDVSLMKLFPNLLFMIRDKTRSKGEEGRRYRYCERQRPRTCDERLNTKTEGSTRLTYTGLRGGLEHLKIETRLIN
jgi:hypothetical protein